MQPWFSKLYVYFSYILCFVLATFSAQTTQPCSCSVRNKPTLNGSQSFIYCEQGWSDSNIVELIPCQRVDDLIRIGPLRLYPPEYENQTVLHQKEEQSIGLAPWAFAGLLQDQSVRRLQLDLNLTDQPINALSLAGLDQLQALLARTSLAHWDGCSFANLPNVKHILLNCKSQFDEFLHFGSSLDMIRFVNCEDSPMQFYCTNCLQNPNLTVIRIRPGPPLRRYMVKFSLVNRSEVENNSGQFAVGRCVSSMCSDSMLCRNNLPLQQARSGYLMPKSMSIDSFSTQTAQTTSVYNTSRHQPLSQADFLLSQRGRLWIMAFVMFVVVFVLITSFVLIALTRHRMQQRKATRYARRRIITSNGHPRPSLLTSANEDSKLELPDII